MRVNERNAIVGKHLFLSASPASYTPSFVKTTTAMTEVAHINGNHLNGHADYEMGNPSQTGGLRFSSGIILPPPEIKGERLIGL